MGRYARFESTLIPDRWYLGLAAAQQRHFAEAGGYWRRLLPLLPPESDQHKAVAAAIEALAKK